MNGRSRLLILTVVIGLVLTIAVGSAGASRHVSDKLKKAATASHVLGGVGRPPLVGGPFGDPADYPGAGEATAQSVDSSSTAGSTSSGDDENCLHAQPRSAC